MTKRTCSVFDCDEPYHSHGYCGAHVQRAARHDGDPLGGGPVRAKREEPFRWLTEVAVPYVGEDCLPWPFGHFESGRGTVNYEGRQQPAHRVVLRLTVGEPPERGRPKFSCLTKNCVNPMHLSWEVPPVRKKPSGKRQPKRGPKHGPKRPLHVDFIRNYVLNFTGDDCLIWPFGYHDKTGYGRASVESKTWLAHRAVMYLAGRLTSDGRQVAHNCGVRLCVNPAHLRMATPSENQLDRRGHGTACLGTENTKAKFVDQDIRNIRAEYAAGGISLAKLAERYDVKPPTIHSIVRRRTWAHVE